MYVIVKILETHISKLYGQRRHAWFVYYWSINISIWHIPLQFSNLKKVSWQLQCHLIDLAQSVSASKDKIKGLLTIVYIFLGSGWLVSPNVLLFWQRIMTIQVSTSPDTAKVTTSTCNHKTTYSDTYRLCEP